MTQGTDAVQRSLIAGTGLNLDVLLTLGQKPEPFAPGEPQFWDDPHIAQQMLAAHLSPSTDAASRRPEIIDRMVEWLVSHLGLRPGDAVLDLGCGPGLYASRLARRGLRVTGVDLSENSLAYARRDAEAQRLAVTYRCQNFLTLDDEGQFDLALQVYGELNVFRPADRDDLLRRVSRALKPGGRFVFDVTTRALRRKYELKNHWYAVESGFWKPGPHLVLEQGFDYPELSLYLDQYVVVEASGTISVYRNWFLDYSPDTIRAALEAQGFRVEEAWGDLAGAPLSPESEWIGIVATKV